MVTVNIIHLIYRSERLLCSVEQHTVQDGSFALDFKVLKNLINLIVKVSTIRNSLHQFMKKEGSYRSFFLVVLDVHVYHVYYVHVSRAPSFQVLQHLVKHPLFRSENNIKSLVGILEPLRCWLDCPVPVQHVQDPILLVQGLVLAGQISPDLAVACAKLVYVWLTGTWARQLYL